ncbi:helix-turn-helix domain-containing protein [Clostridiaceae bacterium M8S5]|nr:helix-turn-helix domain-containing protein [Clostridiaceae bacterium M8S5]
MGKYYTVDQVSDMLDMHPKTIRKFVREGKLKANKVGKQWRITGHDLSVFIEGKKDVKDINNQPTQEKVNTKKVRVSTVVDIYVSNMEEGNNISNMLMAAMNNKDPKYGPSNMSVQFIQSENITRIMLSGSVLFIETMLQSISVLTD